MNIKKQIATSLVALMMLLPPPPITQTAKAVTSTSSAEEIAKELFNYEDDAFKAIYAGVNNSYNSSTHESGHSHGSCIVVDPRITGKVEVYAQRANSTSEDEILGNRDSCSWSFSVNGKGEYSGHSRIRVEYTPSSEDIMNGAVVLCTPQPLTYTGANDLVYFDGSRRYIAIPSTPDYTYKYSTQYLAMV